jgi:filamentous hemagglutinin
VLNVLVGAVTGFGQTAVTKETLASAADEMRALMVEDSKKFPGVVDSTGRVLSNASGKSVGVNGDGIKGGGARVDLDLLCGTDGSRCEIPKKPDGSVDTSKLIVFTGGKNTDGTSKQTLDEFLATDDGKKMSGITGGVQGDKGTLFGKPYEVGSWQDNLIEAFSGTHDMIGGKWSGLYNSQGNTKQGMTNAERTVYDYVVSPAALLPSAPFAAAQGLPPEVWNAISILLKAAK